MKKISLPVAVFVAILGCVLAVSANVTTMKIHDNLKQERYKRIIAEQQLQAAVNDIRIMKTQLLDSRSALDGIRDILNKDRMANTDLQTQLQQMQQDKAKLEASFNELMKQQAEAAGQAADMAQ